MRIFVIIRVMGDKLDEACNIQRKIDVFVRAF
jgi:hypothetical protein